MLESSGDLIHCDWCLYKEDLWNEHTWGEYQMKIGVIMPEATAAAAKSLQSCPTLCDPIDNSPPGFPSLGFSRQEHWSGLPFPSPMHESEK